VAKSEIILLADDDADDVILVRKALNEAGFENPLFVVCDGQEAIQYLSGEGLYADRAQFPFPQLLLLDLKMPQMTGFEVLTWLRQRPEWNGLPVVILTGSCYEPDVKHAYELGANSFLTKPSDFSTFVGTVKQMAHFWLGKARLPQTKPMLPPEPRNGTLPAPGKSP
jgi:CheY-like chemotaxis protein